MNAKGIIRAVVPRSVRNTLRSPGKTSRWVWDSLRYSIGTVEKVQVSPGCTLRCHPIVARSLRKVLVDPRQVNEIAQFVNCCSPSMALFDIGANYGWFACIAAHYGARVIAVEPSPLGCRLMAVQAMLNGCEGQVTIKCAAVSDKPGTLMMLNAGIFSDGYFTLDASRDRRELTPTESVTLDDLTNQYGIPNHVKIDVEGHEAAVLRGALQTLQTKPVLMLELHHKLAQAAGNDPMEPEQVLQQLGYNLPTISHLPEIENVVVSC